MPRRLVLSPGLEGLQGLSRLARISSRPSCVSVSHEMLQQGFEDCSCTVVATFNLAHKYGSEAIKTFQKLVYFPTSLDYGNASALPGQMQRP